MIRHKGLFCERNSSKRKNYANSRYLVLFSNVNKALEIATDLMTTTGFVLDEPIMVRGRIVEVQGNRGGEKDHPCQMCFTSSRVIGNPGICCIQISTCSCGDESPFREIVVGFDRQLKRHRLLVVK